MAYTGIRFALAGVFLVSGVLKWSHPEALASVLDAFGIVPKPCIPFLALLLPGVEVAAGLGLAFDVEEALYVIAGMLVVFICVLAYGIRIGLDIDCGCFGPGDPAAWEAGGHLRSALIRDLFLLGGAGYLYWYRRRYPRPTVRAYVWMQTRLGKGART